MVLIDHMEAVTLSGTSAAIPTQNALDLGSAKVMFPGNPEWYLHVLVGGGANQADNTLKVEFVSADDLALTSNVVVLATYQSGILAYASPYTAHQLPPIAIGGQVTAKQYYGVRTTQGGTTPAFVVSAFVSHQKQLNMLPA